MIIPTLSEEVFLNMSQGMPTVEGLPGFKTIPTGAIIPEVNRNIEGHVKKNPCDPLLPEAKDSTEAKQVIGAPRGRKSKVVGDLNKHVLKLEADYLKKTNG